MHHDLEWAGWFSGLLLAALVILLAGVWAWLYHQHDSTARMSFLQGLMKALTIAMVPVCLIAILISSSGVSVVWLCALLFPLITAILAFSRTSPFHVPQANAMPYGWVALIALFIMALPLTAHRLAYYIVDQHHAGEAWHPNPRPDGSTWLVKESWYDTRQILFIGALDVRRIGRPEMTLGRAEIASPRCSDAPSLTAMMLAPTSPRTFGGLTPLPMLSGCLGQDWIEVPATRHAVLATVALLLQDSATITWEGLIAHGEDNERARDFFENGSYAMPR
ncbi:MULTISPECIES: hypothetical protein [unclassified Zymobacter]|uniref:hypothetical protein n=1 Tax=unclassified Zymobacter TaxID=3048685 RepID=UPI0039C17FF0